MNRPSALSAMATPLLVVGSGLGLFSSLAALSPWPMGLWTDSEPIALTVHAGAALAALGLLLSSLGERWLPAACLRHPFVLTPLLLAAWSLTAMPGAADPPAALLGSPQTAEGPLLFLDAAVFTAAGLVVRQQAGAAALGLLALLAGAVLPVLSLFSATTIYFFGAWMVFAAIAAPIAVVAGLAHRFPRRRTRLLLAAAAGLPGWALSGSFTAIAAGALALPAVWLVCRDGDVGSPRSRRNGLALAALTAAVPILLELGTLAFALLYYGADKPGIRALESVWSRGHLQIALLTDFADHPWHWLTGAGWGQVADIFARTVTAAGLPLWNGSWDMMGRDIVNSHHVLLEALLAAGLPGFGLRVAGLVVLPLACRPEMRRAAGLFALALGTLGSLWFQLPGTVAMVSLATAAFGALEPPPPARPVRRWRPLAVALLACCAVLPASAAIALYREQQAAGALEAAYLAPTAPPPLADCGADRLSGWRARPYLANLLSRSLRQLRAAGPPAAISEASLLAFGSLVCLAGRPPFRDFVPVRTFVLALRGDLALATGTERYRSYFGTLDADWGRDVTDYLARAPRRTDLAISYLLWLDHGNRFAELFAMTNLIQATAPDDPVALWYSGLALARLPGQMPAAFDRLRRALEHGIETRIEVPAALRRQILESPRNGG